MKVVLLSGASCIHTTRWANGLVTRGLDVHLISAHSLLHELDPRVHFYLLPFKAPHGYIVAFRALRSLLARIKPDIVNAHYASGYGLLARLSGFKPLLLSVWGSDVYDFPEKSFLHRSLLKQNLASASAIASTSLCMARKTSETYAHPSVYITPFGIDTDLFCQRPAARTPQTVIVGTVKTLKVKYGVDTLIRAFAIARARIGGRTDVRLSIYGDGPDKEKLISLTEDLGVRDSVTFHGAIPHDTVPEALNSIDIYVALSRLDSESFGVAILEASACCVPVVVSDADGPAEVTVDGVTGMIVPKNDADSAADAISLLIDDEGMRRRMGEAGRSHVLKNYTWDTSLDLMIAAYSAMMSKHSP